jgi:hypothetical protein
LYFRPEHLSFPAYIDPSKHVNGHAEFAIYPEELEIISKGTALKQIVGGRDYILEIEDLLSGKKAEFKL